MKTYHCLLFLPESTMKLFSRAPSQEPVTCQYILSDCALVQTLALLQTRYFDHFH